jgi:hypothetical protein
MRQSNIERLIDQKCEFSRQSRTAWDRRTLARPARRDLQLFFEKLLLDLVDWDTENVAGNRFAERRLRRFWVDKSVAEAREQFADFNA